MKTNAILMVSFDRAKILDKCLSNFKKATNVSYSDIYVVDNGSSEDIKAVVIKYKTNFLREKKNYLVTKALNDAFTKFSIAKKYRYVTFMANDVLVEKNTVNELVKFMDSDTKIGLSGPCAHQTQSNKFSSAGLSISKFTSLLVPYKRKENPKGMNHFASMFILPTALVSKLKGFDQTLFPMVFEEPDLGERVLKAGYKILPCMKAKIYHPIYLEKKRVIEIIKKERILSNHIKTYLFFRNRIIFMKLYSNLASFIFFYFAINPLIFIYYAHTIPLRLYKYVILGLIDGTVFALTTSRDYIKKRSFSVLGI